MQWRPGTPGMAHAAATVGLVHFQSMSTAPHLMETAVSLEGRARARIRMDGSLPLPGRGSTLARWRVLAELGAEDLALAKVLEAHYAELDAGSAPAHAGRLMAVWAAEGPESTVSVRDGSGGPRLSGRKPWCSGARFVDAALLTALDGDTRQLVLVDMRKPGVQVADAGWEAVGMAAIESGPVDFDSLPCRRIGAPGAYVDGRASGTAARA